MCKRKRRIARSREVDCSELNIEGLMNQQQSTCDRYAKEEIQRKRTEKRMKLEEEEIGIGGRGNENAGKGNG